MSDEEYENLHPHDYEGQETERKQILDKHGPILAISHAVHYMKLRLDHNGKENPHRGWGTVTQSYASGCGLQFRKRPSDNTRNG